MTSKYLTGDEILRTGQRKVIEQEKFTFSPLGKALENQTKSIKQHGEQLVEPNAIVQNNYDTEEDYEILLKQKEIFDELTNDRMNDVNKLLF